MFSMTAMLPLLLAMPGWHSKLHTRCWKVPGRPATSNLQGTIAAAPGTMILPGIPYISRPLHASAFSPTLHYITRTPPPSPPLLTWLILGRSTADCRMQSAATAMRRSISRSPKQPSWFGSASASRSREDRRGRAWGKEVRGGRGGDGGGRGEDEA